MKKEFKRHVFVFENHFKDFRKTLDRSTLKKLYQILEYVMLLDFIPERYFKSIVGVEGLYEIRLESGKNIYRVFCCFDEGNIVILFNGFQKKTQKTPIEQIELASRLMHKYFKQKENQNEKTK